jgi:GTP cyclohydrolase I
MEKKHLTHRDVHTLAIVMVNAIRARFIDKASSLVRVYPIPRGGVPVSYVVKGIAPASFEIVDDPKLADIFVDDIVDSGRTAERYFQKYNKPTYALIDKLSGSSYMAQFADKWIVFPWEGEEGKSESIEDNVVRILQYVGEDPNRGGLLETPRRVAKAWTEWTSGYNIDPESVLKVFEDGGEKYDQMVIVKDIPIYSKCEHHLADIFGTATIAYIPNGKIVGLSKLSRLAEVFARRLQVQERLTQQIADSLEQHLQPQGVGVLIRARHMCMESRGLCQQGHHTITTAFHGALKNDLAARQEFMSLA